jgi:hypothetical protein
MKHARLSISVLPFAAAAGLFALGCGGKHPEETTLTETKTVEPVTPVKLGATDAERFGVSAKDFAPPAGAAATANAGYEYDLPQGWSALPAAQFREVNLRVGGEANAECYMTTLGGGGGGLEPNVNRWRQQLSLPPMSSEQIAQLPSTTWFGAPATLVDIEGEWGGMSGEHSAKDWRLVGLLQITGDRARFLKMTGPREVIARELENFQRLVASFRAKG